MLVLKTQYSLTTEPMQDQKPTTELGKSSPYTYTSIFLKSDIK